MAQGLRLVFSAVKGELEEAINRLQDPIAEAASAAIQGAADFTKLRGNQQLMGGGFGPRWRNTFKVTIFPKNGKPSIRAAFLAYHKIPYSGIFDTPGDPSTISGHPMLWLPSAAIPPRIGNRRMTPQLFSQRIGPLRSARGARGPMLVADVAGRISSRSGRFSLGSLQRGARQGGRSIPVFFGVSSVTLRKRFNFGSIFAEAADSLPRRYEAAVKGD